MAILKSQKKARRKRKENNMPYHTGKGSHSKGMKKKPKKKKTK